MTAHHVQFLLFVALLFPPAHSVSVLNTQVTQLALDSPPPRRLQDQEDATYVDAATSESDTTSEFDLLCLQTYDAFDWIILIGCVVICMLFSVCCGWMLHIWWTSDEYDPRLSVNCREMVVPASIAISPSLSDKLRTKLTFAGTKLRGLKDRYSNNQNRDGRPSPSPPLDMELAQAQVYAQGQRYSQGFGQGRPQTPGQDPHRNALSDLSGSMGDDSRTRETPTATSTAAEAETRDTETPPHGTSGTGTTGLYMCTPVAMDGKDGIRELTIASTEEKWMTPKMISPKSEQTDRSVRYSTPL